MSKITISICALALLGSPAVSQQQEPGYCDTLSIAAAGSTPAKEKHESIRDSITQYAKLYLGRPYRSGGKGQKSFDCSGFTQFVFKRFGHTLGASSAVQYQETKRIAIAEVKPGDLLFFKGRNASEKRVGHVALAYEIDDEKSITFIHAALNGGVRFDQYPNSPYYKKRYIGAGRVLEEEKLPNDTTGTKGDEENNENAKEIATAETAQTERSDSTFTTIRHTIEKGDNLYQLSRKYKTSIEKIKRDNSLKSNNLKVGEVLTIEKEKGKD